MGLEVHHIVPEAEGGPDSEDNAAPLCPTCHRTLGGNPELRSRIREMRDSWYKTCERLFAEREPGQVFRSIHELFSTEELERLTIHNPTYVLGSAGERLGLTRFSFHGEEYIHPLILKEVLGWISDRNETVVAVDLKSANRSNRFSGDFSVKDDGAGTLVEWRDEGESFTYRHVATTPSGVEIVECYDWGGGSGIFGTVALFCLERDRAAEAVGGLLSSRDRHVLKILGQFGLGDRYSGDIQYANGVLEVGPDRGWFRRGGEAARRLPIL